MNWFVIGIVASLIYGTCAVLFKLLIAERYLNSSPAWAMMGMGIGWFLCGLIGSRIWPPTVLQATYSGLAWGIPVGALNGVATILILVAFQLPSTNVSQLVPVYNTNTLVAFILGILFFRELPMGPDLFRNALGAVMIVTGTILIGK